MGRTLRGSVFNGPGGPSLGTRVVQPSASGASSPKQWQVRGYMGLAATTWVLMGAKALSLKKTPSNGYQKALGKDPIFEKLSPCADWLDNGSVLNGKAA